MSDRLAEIEKKVNLGGVLYDTGRDDGRTGDLRWLIAEMKRLTMCLDDLLMSHRPHARPTGPYCDGCANDWPCSTYRRVRVALAAHGSHLPPVVTSTRD